MRNSKSGLFLMEMIIAILVFSISAAVCVKIFARAYLTSKDTQILNSSVTICTSAAELFYGYRGDMSKIQHELDPRHMSRAAADSLKFYYDSDFASCHEGNASFCLTMQNLRSEDLLTTHIAMIDLADNSTVYWLDCKLYLRQTGVPQEVLLPDAEPAQDMMEGGVL